MVCLLGVTLIPAAAQTRPVIVVRTPPLLVDFADTADDSGAKGAIATKTSPLLVDFADAAKDSGAKGAISTTTSPLLVDFADAAAGSGATAITTPAGWDLVKP